ncbi:MAG: hypothetical protein V1831_04450 [Candidatus Woesearchaeota archaeon]
MNKKIIFTVIVSLFLIAGCTGGSKEERSITDVNVRVGTEGLTMVFMQNAPPGSVFENSRFPIAIELKNNGAEDINGGEGKLVFGFEKTYVDGECKEEDCDISIQGKSVFNPIGSKKIVTITANAKTVGPQSETHPSTILATACYPYKTILGSSVCIDTDIYGERKGKKACTVHDLSFSKGQGAPVAITKIEPRMLYADQNKVTPQFIIYVENVGNGEVVDSGKVENACSSGSLLYTDFNVLKVVSVSLSGKELDCKVDKETNSIRLRDKADMIVCEVKDADDVDRNLDAYTAPLKIELVYGYTFTISKNIVIEKILTH